MSRSIETMILSDHSQQRICLRKNETRGRSETGTAGIAAFNDKTILKESH